MTNEMLPTERVALVTYWLTTDNRISIAVVSRRLSITDRGARLMLTKISHVLPLHVDDDGFWSIIETSTRRRKQLVDVDLSGPTCTSSTK